MLPDAIAVPIWVLVGAFITWSGVVAGIVMYIGRLLPTSKYKTEHRRLESAGEIVRDVGVKEEFLHNQL